MLEPRDLPLLAVFAAVAHRGSFTAAAAELGISKSAASDQVRALEERCGVRLLERSTRRQQLTQVGEDVLRAADAVLDAAREVDAVVEEHRDALVGTLRITTTQDLGPRFVAPVAARLAAKHERLRVEVVSDDILHDLIAGHFDVAVRLGALRDSGYVMRRLGVEPELIVAAKTMAGSFARASHPRDLAGAPWVRHSVVSRGDGWTFRGPDGATEHVTVSVRAQANTAAAMRAMILAGAGLGVLPRYMVADDLRNGALVRVCPDWTWKDITLYAMLPSNKRLPKRVTAFLEALKQELSASGLLSTR